MTPNAENHNPDPAYLRDLIDQAGISQRKAARLIGIDERTMRSYLASRTTKKAMNAPYAVQYCLEQLNEN